MSPAIKENKIVISPVTRVEGHGKVTIKMDGNGKVDYARFHIVEFRGFERFAQGRFYWEMPVLIQRLCGICPVSHDLCAAKGTDVIVGVDKIPVTAEKMRRLMHYGRPSRAMSCTSSTWPRRTCCSASTPTRRSAT